MLDTLYSIPYTTYYILHTILYTANGLCIHKTQK